jgi:hypothetical protein
MTTATAAATTTTAPAPRVISCRMLPAGSGMGLPLAPAIYSAQRRARDGVWTWRVSENCLLGTVYGRDGHRRERGVYSAAKAERLAAEIAAERGIPEASGVRHGTPLTPAQIREFGLA